MSQDNQEQRILTLKQKRNGVEKTINALRGANPKLKTGRDTIENIYQDYKDIINEYAKKNTSIFSIIQKKENLINLDDQEINQLKSFIDFCLLLIAKKIQEEIDNLLKEEEEEEKEELKTGEETEEKEIENEDEDVAREAARFVLLNENPNQTPEQISEEVEKLAEDVAREAARFVLLNENPNQTPEQISEEVEKLAVVFSEYYRDEYDKNPSGIAKILQKSVQERYGVIAEKEFVSHFDQIINPGSNISEESKIALLQEFMRKDLQANLLKTLEDRLLLEKIFFHPTDTAFQEFIDSPFFTYIYESLKKEVVQNNRSGFAGILSSTNPLSNFKYDENTNENNHALLFVTTADRLNILRKNPDLYNRFVQAVASSQNIFIPQNSQEAFLGLLVASFDPQEKESFYNNLYALMINSGFQEEQHPYHNLFLFLKKIKSKDKNNPSFSWLLLFKTYALGFGKDILQMYGFFSSKTGSIGYKLSGGGKFIPRTVGFVGRKLIGGSGGKLTESLLKRFAPSVLGGPVGIALTAGLGVLKKMSSYFFQDVPFLKDVAQSLSLEKIIIGSLVLVFLMFIVFLSPSNPVQTQQKVMPVDMFESSLQYEEKNVDIALGCYKDASQIVAEAEKILERLQQGIWNFWNYHPDYPQYGKYSKIANEGGLIEGKKATDWYEENIYKGGTGSPRGEDLFWCTWLVSIAYRKAGAPAPFTAGVKYAYSRWVGKKISAESINPFDVPLGSAIFFSTPKRPLNHIGILCERITQNGKDGAIVTCESNAGVTKYKYNVVNGKLQESRLSNNEYMTISAYGLPPDADPNSESCEENVKKTPTLREKQTEEQ